ncbi:hypothetical protein [[Actinomadura] parvosata]|uniref:hypothetical protein n=1 Tax=[Actinomadura] parvosata TaxID=1955412 RepID=UPI0016465691
MSVLRRALLRALVPVPLREDGPVGGGELRGGRRPAETPRPRGVLHPRGPLRRCPGGIRASAGGSACVGAWA